MLIPRTVRPPTGTILTPGDTASLDAISVLSLFLVLLLVVPSNRSVGALGGAGAPALLLALGAFVWWCWYHIQRVAPSLARKSQPVRIAVLAFAACAILSYAAGASRALSDAELNALNLGVLRMAALAGILLVALDGIPNRKRLLILLRRVCLFGGLFALLGLMQFATGYSFVDSISIPGLSVNDASALQDRAGFNRAEATSRHPLEYAFVLSMILPLALTLALTENHRNVFARWFPVAAISSAALLSVSRSAIVGVLVGFLVLLPSLSASNRRRLIAAALGAVILVGLLVPGMLGTIRGLFGGEDTSLASRTNSYDTALAFVELNPWVGRGFGTFLPQYKILDNQYLLLLIETGFLGLIAFGGLLITAMLVAVRAQRHYEGPLGKMGQALAASLASGAVLTAFFDAFSFPQAAGTLFFIAGLSGAYWRMREVEGTQRYA